MIVNKNVLKQIKTVLPKVDTGRKIVVEEKKAGVHAKAVSFVSEGSSGDLNAVNLAVRRLNTNKQKITQKTCRSMMGYRSDQQVKTRCKPLLHLRFNGKECFFVLSQILMVREIKH